MSLTIELRLRAIEASLPVQREERRLRPPVYTEMAAVAHVATRSTPGGAACKISSEERDHTQCISTHRGAHRVEVISSTRGSSAHLSHRARPCEEGSRVLQAWAGVSTARSLEEAKTSNPLSGNAGGFITVHWGIKCLFSESSIPSRASVLVEQVSTTVENEADRTSRRRRGPHARGH